MTDKGFSLWLMVTGISFGCFLATSSPWSVIPGGIAYGLGLGLLDRWFPLHPRCCPGKTWRLSLTGLVEDLAIIGGLLLLVSLGGLARSEIHGVAQGLTWWQFGAGALIAYGITEVADWLPGGHYRTDRGRPR